MVLFGLFKNIFKVALQILFIVVILLKQFSKLKFSFVIQSIQKHDLYKHVRTLQNLKETDQKIFGNPVRD